MKVVLDTNVFVSSVLTPKGQSGRILDAWARGLFELAVTPAIIGEFRVVLGRVPRQKYPAAHELAARLLNRLEAAVTSSETDEIVEAVRDPGDDKIVEAALLCSADLIVTNDRDLLDPHEVLGVPVVGLGDFLRTLGMRP